MSGDEVIKKVTVRLENLSTVQTKELYCLKYKGKMLKLSSGKSSWNKKGHAVSAFTNEINQMFDKRRDGWEASEVTKLLIADNILTVQKLY